MASPDCLSTTAQNKGQAKGANGVRRQKTDRQTAVDPLERSLWYAKRQRLSVPPHLHGGVGEGFCSQHEHLDLLGYPLPIDDLILPTLPTL